MHDAAPNPRLLFLSPEFPHPSGGVRVLYRHVSILRSLGHDAHIVHRTPGYRDRWCGDILDVSIIPPPRVPNSGRDIIVLPEIEGSLITRFPGVPKVIYCQNPFYAFRPFGQSHSDPPPLYGHPDVVAVTVVSEEGLRHLTHAFPRVPILRMRNAIDLAMFSVPAEPKRKQIAFMPRKLSEDVRQVVGLLRLRGALNDWKLAPIDNMGLSQVARILRESAVFLSFSVCEGFGLPPAEAMACGCIVVGYHGIGGREYLTPDHAFPIEQGDVLAFAMAVERILKTYDSDPAAYAAMTQSAAAFIRDRYSPENERADVAATWEEILRLRADRLQQTKV